MRFDRAFRVPAGARPSVAALLAATVIALLIVGPVAAERGPVRLTDPSVSPVNVTAGQSVTFTVVYSNGQGNGPASIVVTVGSVAYPMSASSGTTNYGGGVTYTAVAAPRAGTWSVEFVATDKFGNSASLAGASLTVVAPAPAPTPKPTPAPTPRPTPAPTPTPPPSPGQTGAPSSSTAGAASGGGSSSAGGTSSGGTASGSTSGGSTSGSGPMTVTAGQLDDGLPPWQASVRAGSAVATVGAPEPAASSSGAPARVEAVAGDDWKTGAWRIAGAEGPVPGDDWKTGSWRTVGAGGIAASGSGALSPSLAAALGASGGGLPLEQLLTTAIVTLGGVAMAMSFMLFGRRRRDDEPTDTDEALAAAAGMGAGAVGTGALVGGIARRPAPVALAPLPRDAELDLPRWRRPSLLAARKEDPLRVVHTDSKMTFDHGAVPPIQGVERRMIRYRLVRLLDSPDELVAGEVGFLDEGDEVQLLRRSGAYWLVLCPDGREGWVHRMVLGEAVGDPTTEPPPDEGRDLVEGDPQAGSFLGAAAGIRLASEGATAWSLQAAPATDAGMDIDEDVLRAYLAARGRA